MALVTCVAFRAAEDKIPGDISRNWERIERIIPPSLTGSVMMDPKDSAVYVIALRETDPETAHRLVADLDHLKDERDNHPLIAEAECRTMSAEYFGTHSHHEH